MTPAIRRRLFVLCCGVLLALALPATSASAHATLVRSNPASGVVLDRAPAEVVLAFSEGVRPVADRISVTGPDGKRADTGRVSVVGPEVHVPLRPDPPRGTYLVSFRVISGDSHPIGGGLTFSVGEVSTAPVESAGAVRTDRVVAIAFGVVRFLGYAGLMLLVGPTLVLLALWPRRLPTAGPGRLALLGAGLLGLATAGGLYLQIPYSLGTGLFTVTGPAARQVLDSPFAAASLVRLVVVAAVVVLLRPVLAQTAGPADRVLLGVLAMVGLSTWSISGHAGASALPALTVLADAAHLAAMAVWLGGLVMLFGFLLRQATQRELAAILPVWSGWAAFAVTVLVLSGITQALVEIGTPRALAGTTYGRLVLVKVTLLGLVLAIAAYSRRLVNRHVAGSAGSAGSAGGRLRVGVLAELGIAAVVLAVTAVLVQTAPARTADASANAPVEPFSVTLATDLFTIEVEVEPAKVGANTLHLYAFTPSGGSTTTPMPVAQWRATAALPARGIEPIDIPVLAITPDHAQGQVLLPTPGLWQLAFTVRTDEINQKTVTAQVNVRAAG